MNLYTLSRNSSADSAFAEKITLNENAELHVIEYTINESKSKFINNSYENVILHKNSKFRKQEVVCSLRH